MSVREPAWSGSFYRGNATDLLTELQGCFTGPGGPGSLPSVNHNGPRRIVGLMCPHAGFRYSGSTAAWCYHRLAQDGLPETVVLIGPNHRSYHPAVALASDTEWRTPLGESPVDLEIISAITEAYPSAEYNLAVHYAEHSLEVQLPFLQYLSDLGGRRIKIVPILIGASAYSRTVELDVNFARRLGKALAGALEGRDVVVVASTDMSHYEPSETARARDYRAIPTVLNLDEVGLIRTLETLKITMCGGLPTAAAIVACKEMGAVSAAELAYRNSGEVTGDFAEVVAYSALEIDR